MEYRALKRRCLLEQEIINLIHQDNGASCHFDYAKIDDDDGMILTLITHNPEHQEIFTLYTTEPGRDEIECLDQAIVYLKELKNKDNGFSAFVVEWQKRDHNQMHKSHFYAKNMVEVLDKFFENKNSEDFSISSIKLCPES